MIFMLGNLLILTLLVKHFLFKPRTEDFERAPAQADA